MNKPRASARRFLQLLSCGASALALGVAVNGGAAWAQDSTVQPPAPPTPPGQTPTRPNAVGTRDAAEQAGAETVGNQTNSGTQASNGTSSPTTVSAVVVTGIRASLQTSQAIKRNAETFVDSITAEDIGALPDRSVTEALQRVPGVSIDRFAAGRDPDHYSAEGSGVFVRGLSFVRSEFNGRDAFTANNGRSLGFQDVPAELVGGVDVFKNQSADMIEGGIAGSINIRTRVPFDQKGFLIAGGLEASYGDMSKKGAPSGSVLLSDRWTTNVGEVGLLVDFVNSELKYRSDGQQISNYGTRYLDASGNLLPSSATTGSRQVYFPRGAAFREDDHVRDRTGYAAAAQWRSPDQTMLATLQFLRSDTREAWTEHAIEIATDVVSSNGDSFPVQGTTVSFDNNGVFQNGVITGTTGWAADQYSPNCCRVPYYGLQSNNIRRDVAQRNVVNDYGLNLKWTPNASWSFNFDLHHVDASVGDIDVSILDSTYQNVGIQMHGSDLPTVQFLPPSLNGTVPQCAPSPGNALPQNGGTACPTYYNAPHNNFSDPYNAFNRAVMDHIEQSQGTENAVRLDGEYTFADDSFIRSAKFGYRWADRDEVTRYSTYNWGVITEQWGNGGPIWLNQTVNGTLLSPNYSTYAFPGFMRGDVAPPTAGEPRLFYNMNTVSNYTRMTQFALMYANAWEPTGHWLPLASRPGVIPGTPFLPSEINPVDETTNAFYGMLRYGHRFDNGINVTGNLGVRYFKTDRTTQGYQAFPLVNYPTEAQCATIPAGQTPPVFCTLPLATRNAARAFANGAMVANNQNTSFDYWLPSWNMRVDIGGGKLFRFAVSKAITPPDIGLTRNYFNVTLGGSTAGTIVNGQPEGTVTAGNPLLRPMSSWNYDASFEWYFARVGQLSVGLFYKELTDVITNGTVRENFTNNGSTFSAVATTPINASGSGKVKGFEIAYQQVYSWLPGLLSGFGLNANYTYVDSKGVRQTTLSNTDPDVAAGTVANVDTSKLPLQGMSKHTINIVPFYEKGPWSLRLAYNWRSRYLLTARDVIVPYAPIYQEDRGQLDGSIFYSINSHVKVGLEAVNLTNTITRTSQVVNNNLLTAPRSWFMEDRRYTLSLRANF